MTFREKLALEHPDRIGECYDGGCQGCPCHYGYEDKAEVECFHKCEDCWNREIPEDVPMSDPTLTVSDPVNHPAHYTNGGIECIDAIASALSAHTDPMDAFLTGQVLKYMWRWPLKNGKEDLEKARFYLNRLIERKGGNGECE